MLTIDDVNSADPEPVQIVLLLGLETRDKDTDKMSVFLKEETPELRLK